MAYGIRSSRRIIGLARKDPSASQGRTNGPTRAIPDSLDIEGLLQLPSIGVGVKSVAHKASGEPVHSSCSTNCAPHVHERSPRAGA